MPQRRLRLLVAISTACLALGAGIPWAHEAAASPPVADFAPTYAPREAAARIASARARQV